MKNKFQLTAPAVLFDLDGTLMDSNYEHVTAWQLAFQSAGIEVPNFVVHRCIGMRGSLLIKTVFKEIGRTCGEQTSKRLEKLHGRYFDKQLSSVKPLPGAPSLLKALSRRKVPWAIATGGDKRAVMKMIGPLSVPAIVPVVTADDVDQAKPEPDVFLVAAQRLGVSLSDSIVVGDSVWDILGARRAKAIGVGLLSGGYSESELGSAGAYRVYKDPADLLDHLEETGIDT
ncbi:MAG TPA: HAD family hydrolase [Terriglobales bacterium]|nr:HAD family hydrolase [Terriglobales bacterium]